MVENKFIWRLILVLIPIVIFFFTYWKVINGFFQQDEWFTFGSYITYRSSSFASILKYLFAFNTGHYNPFTNLVQFIFFRIWGIDYAKFALFGLVLEIANVSCIFLLAKRIFKKDIFLAYLTAILFLSFAASSQAVSWVVVNTATLSAALFGIISVIFFCDFIKSRKRKFIFVSILFLLISLFFKEVTIGLFPLYFLILLFLSLREIFFVILSGAVYFVFRVLMFFVPSSSHQKIVTQTLPVNYLVNNFITLPFKSLSQILVPKDVLIEICRGIALFFAKSAGSPGTTKFDLFILNNLIGPISIIIALFLISIIVFFFFKKKTNLRTVAVISLIWILLNSLIFALAPETKDVTVLVDSRNLYFTSIGMAFLIVAFVKSFSVSNRKLVFILLPLIALNIFLLNQNLSEVVRVGQIRKNFLDQIYFDYPKLNKQTVFYVESDSSYYGLPSEVKIPPFQSGFGQTLLVWYSRGQSFPKEFYQNNFLWAIDSEGYLNVDGVGFGYYRNFSDLAKFYSQNKHSEIQIIAYKFNSKTNELLDISGAVKKEVQELNLLK